MINYCRDGGRSKRGATLVRGSSTSLVLRFFKPCFKAHLIHPLAHAYYSMFMEIFHICFLLIVGSIYPLIDADAT